MMEWGVELWDQFENVDKHLHHGIDFSDRYMKFAQDRCSAEQDYAKQLRRLVKKYQPKKKDDDSSIFSTHKAFQSQLSELNDIAGQHELVAETMMKEIVKSLQVFVNELRMEKKRFYQEGRQLQTQLDAHEKALEKTKKKFENEFREYERAQANFEKLDADANVTKAEVDKAKQASIAKKDSVDSCKADYASMLTRFNKEQTDHYKIHMPKVFEQYRETDEKRIKKTSEVMEEFAKADSDVKPIINKCLEGMKRAAQAVDANLDAKLVVEKYKSGFYIPKDKEFEDYTAPQQHLSVNEEYNSPRNSVILSSRSSNKKGLSWLFGGKKPKAGRIEPFRRSSSDTNVSEDVASQDGDKKSVDSMNCSSTTPETSNKNVKRKRALSAGKKIHADLSTQTSCMSTQSTEESNTKVQLREKKSGGPLDVDTAAIRASLKVGKKKIMSIFKERPSPLHKPPPKPPRHSVHISGPVMSSLDSAMLTMSSSDYMIPVKKEREDNVPPVSPSAENPYTEVHFSEDEFTDDSQDGDLDTPKKVAESADYSHLPPEQRKKKLQKHIDELRGQIAKETDGRNGLKKMQEVYLANPALGDPGSLEGQLRQSSEAIEKLEKDLAQYEAWYSDASGGAPARQTSVQPSPSKATYSQPLKTTSDHNRSQYRHEDSFADEFEEEGEAVGTCTALFDFDANSEGSMSMHEGDTFSILEVDKGDGWTRVLKDDIDGYVPTSYLDIQLF